MSTRMAEASPRGRTSTSRAPVPRASHLRRRRVRAASTPETKRPERSQEASTLAAKKHLHALEADNFQGGAGSKRTAEEVFEWEEGDGFGAAKQRRKRSARDDFRRLPLVHTFQQALAASVGPCCALAFFRTCHSYRVLPHSFSVSLSLFLSLSG